MALTAAPGSRVGIWLETPGSVCFLGQEMRRFTLPGTFLILWAALYFLWQYRFERSPEFPTITLSALLMGTTALPPGVEHLGMESQPILRLRVDKEHPRVVMRFDLPAMKPVDLLYLRFQANSKKLTPGKETWEDGRGLIEWHSPAAGPGWENDPVCSARFDQKGEIRESVSRPLHAPAIPALRLENLGTSGDFEISIFEATVVRERLLWKIGRWILMAGWLAWMIASTRFPGRGGFIRSLASALIWLVMGIYFVVPGPWKSIHSLGSQFQIGPEISVTHAEQAATPVGPDPSNIPVPSALETVGKIPDMGDFTLRLKHYAANARPLLHMMMLFGPTLLAACLIGKHPTMSLAIIFALATEAAEFAFGYGFDRVDCFDLICDAAGIALALAAYPYLKHKFLRIAFG